MDEASGPAKDKTALAEDRTDYAADRTALANERTSSAWIRTGIAGLVGGYAVIRFLGDALPVWALRTTASICMLASIAAFTLSAWRYRHLGVRLKAADVRTIPFPVIVLINVLLALAALLGLGSVWLA